MRFVVRGAHGPREGTRALSIWENARVALAQDLLNLAGETGTQIQAVWPDSEADRRLFWAAVNLGGALAAVGMIDKLETLEGLVELQAVLQVESYDVVEAAAVGLAARSAAVAKGLFRWALQGLNL